MSPENKEAEAYLDAFEKSVKSGESFRSAPRKNADKKPREPRVGMPQEDQEEQQPTRERIAVTEQTWEPGDILGLDDGTIGIYKSQVAGKEHQLVYFLDKTGEVKPQGVMLAAYDVQKIGSVSTQALETFKQTRHWSRDAVVFGIDKWEDVAKLPPATDYKARAATVIGGVNPSIGGVGAPAIGADTRAVPSASSSAAPSAPQQQEAPKKPVAGAEYGLEPGRRFTIKFGDNDWNAVYWGKDEQGDIVVHDTNKMWTAMHLKLSRFEETLVVGEKLSGLEMAEVHKQISGS